MDKILARINFKPFLTLLGAIGGAITTAFGGWSTDMTVLIICMGVDYIAGLVVAGVFKVSPKSETGALDSRAGWRGLCRKGMTLLIVLVAAQIDTLIDTTWVRDAVCVAYTANELISITENAGLMGVPVPAPITKAINLLQSKGNDDD